MDGGGEGCGVGGDSRFKVGLWKHCRHARGELGVLVAVVVAPTELGSFGSQFTPRRFGPNSAPQGGFRASGGSSERQCTRATFAAQIFSTVLPPAAAICKLLVFFGGAGAGEPRENLAAVWGQNRAKNTKKGIFPLFGTVLGKTPAIRIRWHIQCEPDGLRLGPSVPLGPERLTCRRGPGRGRKNDFQVLL